MRLHYPPADNAETLQNLQDGQRREGRGGQMEMEFPFPTFGFWGEEFLLLSNSPR